MRLVESTNFLPGFLAIFMRHDLELRPHRPARRRSLDGAVHLAGDVGEHRDDPLRGATRGAAALRPGVCLNATGPALASSCHISSFSASTHPLLRGASIPRRPGTGRSSNLPGSRAVPPRLWDRARGRPAGIAAPCSACAPRRRSGAVGCPGHHHLDRSRPVWHDRIGEGIDPSYRLVRAVDQDPSL